jgi:hypothetical protein
MIAPITARKHPAGSPGADRLWACPSPPPRRAPTMPSTMGPMMPPGALPGMIHCATTPIITSDTILTRRRLHVLLQGAASPAALPRRWGGDTWGPGRRVMASDTPGPPRLGQRSALLPGSVHCGDTSDVPFPQPAALDRLPPDRLGGLVARARARSGSSATRGRVLHGEGMGLHHEACGPPPCAPPHRPLCQSVPVVDRGPPPPHRGAPRSVMPSARSKPHATLCSPVPAHGSPPRVVSGREVLPWVSYCESAVSQDERQRCLPGLRAGVREARPTMDAPACGSRRVRFRVLARLLLAWR